MASLRCMRLCRTPDKTVRSHLRRILTAFFHASGQQTRVTWLYSVIISFICSPTSRTGLSIGIRWSLRVFRSHSHVSVPLFMSSKLCGLSIANLQFIVAKIISQQKEHTLMHFHGWPSKSRMSPRATLARFHP